MTAETVPAPTALPLPPDHLNLAVDGRPDDLHPPGVPAHATRIDIGCGNAKRDGFYGLDFVAGPNVDYRMNFETEPLPFPDNSIEYVYSNHAFEHLAYLPKVLKEIVRVCKHDATVEIWTPYGPSRDAYLPGHVHHMNETLWRHICWSHDRNFLDDVPGYLLWTDTRYSLTPGILEELAAQNITIEFALKHLFDIAPEWGVLLQVKKDEAQAPPGPQTPRAVYCYNREPIPEPEPPPPPPTPQGLKGLIMSLFGR